MILLTLYLTSILGAFTPLCAHLTLPGRSEDDPCKSIWGLPILLDERRKEDRYKTEGDSVLLLRTMYVIWIASNSGSLKGAFLEHPADPAEISNIPYAWDCSSIWPTRFMNYWCVDIGATPRTFDQCRYGHKACPKSTTIADKLGMVDLDGKFCTCWSPIRYREGITPAELGRYGMGLMHYIADKIADPTPTAQPTQSHTNCHKLLELSEWSSRKSDAANLEGTQVLPIQNVRLGFKMRPMRDGAGKPSPGNLAPNIRTRNPLATKGEEIIKYCIKWGGKVDLHKKSKTHPFPPWFLADIEHILSDNGYTDCTITNGQPFKLNLVKQLLIEGKDPDYDYMDRLAEGLNIGVEEQIPMSPGIWPSKAEMRGEELSIAEDEDDETDLLAVENYSSADVYIKEIRQTYVDEKELDMVIGPLTRSEAVTACGCSDEELITGAMGANIEADKIRPIFDASVTNVNPKIQRNTLERTTAPGLADGAHAARWCHRNIGWQYDKLGCLRKFTTGKKMSYKTTRKPWQIEHHAELLTVLKSDVSKAHRRCMIRQKDWRYQVATIGKEYWINKVGTYGVASAQVHWGRLAAAIVRLLYYLFPEVDWIMIFVDDIIAIMNKLFETPLSMAIMASLYAMGCPMAWHKTSIGHHSTWVGFEMELEIPRFIVAKPKLELILSDLTLWLEGGHRKHKEILKTVSRIQWGTAACPMAKPFLQPIWAWMKAVENTGGKPSSTLKQIATMLMKMLSKHWYPDVLDKTVSEWHGASDASRRDDRSGIGGWVHNKLVNKDSDDEKYNVWWFMEEFEVDGRDSWLFHGATPRERVAPMELYGTLMLLEALKDKTEAPSSHMMYFKAGTDNKGNAMSILNSRCKTWPSSIIMMELIWSAHLHNIELGVRHIYREGNKWADQLAGGDSTGFNPYLKLRPAMAATNWELLKMFTTKEALSTAIAKAKRSNLPKKKKKTPA